MNHRPRPMTLADMLCILRQRLLDVREQNDQATLAELKTTFTLLREASYSSEDKRLVEILVSLEDSARDTIMGVPWKSDIPPEELIRSVLASLEEK